MYTQYTQFVVPDSRQLTVDIVPLQNSKGPSVVAHDAITPSCRAACFSARCCVIHLANQIISLCCLVLNQPKPESLRPGKCRKTLTTLTPNPASVNPRLSMQNRALLALSKATVGLRLQSQACQGHSPGPRALDSGLLHCAEAQQVRRDDQGTWTPVLPMYKSIRTFLQPALVSSTGTRSNHQNTG